MSRCNNRQLDTIDLLLALAQEAFQRRQHPPQREQHSLDMADLSVQFDPLEKTLRRYKGFRRGGAGIGDPLQAAQQRRTETLCQLAARQRQQFTQGAQPHPLQLFRLPRRQ